MFSLCPGESIQPFTTSCWQYVDPLQYFPLPLYMILRTVSFDQTENRMLGLYVRNNYLTPCLLILHELSPLTYYLIVMVLDLLFVFQHLLSQLLVFQLLKLKHLVQPQLV